MIFLAPILLPTVGAVWLFVIATAMFAVVGDLRRADAADPRR